ncbi:hypothetical protein [Edaphobacter aggregans]|uniref:Y-family DNA polymerase n=1 Tax=Edaphobacter aggregans TaxID=570835 RepID=UPI00316AD07C
MAICEFTRLPQLLASFSLTPCFHLWGKEGASPSDPLIFTGAAAVSWVFVLVGLWTPIAGALGTLPRRPRVAKKIRDQIREELNLTASAGVVPSKFLAKIASDAKKPNGLFVIQPHEVQSFLLPLPWVVSRLN